MKAPDGSCYHAKLLLSCLMVLCCPHILFQGPSGIVHESFKCKNWNDPGNAESHETTFRTHLYCLPAVWHGARPLSPLALLEKGANILSSLLQSLSEGEMCHFMGKFFANWKKPMKTYTIKLLAAKPGCRIGSKEVHICCYYFSVSVVWVF